MSNLKIFTENIEPEALDQINTLLQQPIFEDCKIRIMPDVHAGTGCVIGFTANLGKCEVIPNIVGTDIGCGILTIKLGKIDINFEKLDQFIKTNIPYGKNVNETIQYNFDELENLYCYSNLKDTNRIKRSICSLGGGNHFIEIDIDESGNKYLVIHSGSRNLGKQVAEYYQNLAFNTLQGIEDFNEMKKILIKVYKECGKHKEIQAAIEELNKEFYSELLKIPKELSYLTGQNRDNYLHDMKICQKFASINRKTIARSIVEHLFNSDNYFSKLNMFETIHNYIEHDTNIVRKGAISAKFNEKVLIPINMRDGCIIGIGKGNDDWNCSAPHGAGRLISRSKAKELISLDDFRNSMTGIFTTSVNQSTIDESPFVYKPMDEIINNISDTVDIEKIIKPIYNFKANE